MSTKASGSGTIYQWSSRVAKNCMRNRYEDLYAKRIFVKLGSYTCPFLKFYLFWLDLNERKNLKRTRFLLIQFVLRFLNHKIESKLKKKHFPLKISSK